jgi:transposase InsO family protein
MPTGAPCDRLDTDILRSMPVNPTGNIYNLTVTDYFTKWIQVFPIPDQTAVVDLDVPLLYIQIRAESMSEIFQELCELLEIRKTRTSPNNPKANGQMERFNRTLLAMIKSYLRGEQTNWDLNLGCLVGAYRATPNESTGLAPNLLLFGREIRMPYEIVKERISFGLEENSKNWG